MTPIETLKLHYRNAYNAKEYSWSMERIYEWTPDECIPEFYSDVSVFRSVHKDMQDIELPSWCDSAEQFVAYHRGMLESDNVSENLHNWIDLMFGYKVRRKRLVFLCYNLKQIILHFSSTEKPQLLRKMCKDRTWMGVANCATMASPACSICPIPNVFPPLNFSISVHAFHAISIR